MPKFFGSIEETAFNSSEKTFPEKKFEQKRSCFFSEFSQKNLDFQWKHPVSVV